ncbi:hypothetical protein FJTKL_11750 [Diaporthe vaccinii]|uniref:Uncharacterized protein n=1 Tax=Diaporthe vaccinii TaxID=105482 RepID=A0ABR4EFZ6_9PEZI
MRPATPLVLIALVAAAGGVSDTTNEVINRDVVIVGGGASGAHAAVKLRDMGKTIALVEKRDKTWLPGAHRDVSGSPHREAHQCWGPGLDYLQEYHGLYN